MLNRTSKEARQCRRCKQAEPHVRFAPLSFRICLDCRDTARLTRKENLDLARKEAETLIGQARQPARVTRTGNPHGRPESGACPSHLAWVRTLRCVVGWGCSGITHAHHVREGTGGGTGMKPADRWAVPLCAAHHSELHTGGHATFERRYGVHLRARAADLARFSPHLERPIL